MKNFKNFKGNKSQKNFKRRDMLKIRNFAFKKTREKIKMNYANEEFVLIQAINAYNEIVRSSNLFMERITEWFGLYFPEIKLGSIAQFREFFNALESKEELNTEDFAKIAQDTTKAEEQYAKYMNSSGRKLNSAEKEIVAAFVKFITETDLEAGKIEAYIKEASNRLLPNTTYLTDEKIAAELLDKAGSLDKLAMMPASTIQLLGAEKALFKHIKFGSKPPKYGILFKLPAINAEKRNLRGKIARAYASKIAIALKADTMSKNFIAKELKESLEKSIEKIKKSETGLGDKRGGD
ncbi:MAG: NOP58 family protein [Candidatus Marsarchaeota archaeon]|nr:NOP58 family protein [Candidatus Marsarchaeota archaeon]MCL5106479.1 NOP58 family protein [Candidatus Marsarchaeota archaeon]